MNDTDLLVPFVSYALLMSFTPGPNNISASVLGVQQGYRHTLPYLFGITAGFFVILLAGANLTEFLTKNYSVISPYLKWTGVAYMVWLAASLFLPSHKKAGGQSRLGFGSGFVLQFLNPKGLLYGVTIFTSFAPLLTGSLFKNLAWTLFLTVVCFAAISTWTLGGSALSRWFENPRFKLAFNVVMVGLLAYSAVSIVVH